MRRRPRRLSRCVRIALGLALVVAAIYLLTANGHLLGQDQEFYYRMARSLAHERTFAIEPLVFRGTEIGGARGRDGRFYAQYAPGLPVLLAPIVRVGDSLRERLSIFASYYPWIHEGDGDVPQRVLVSYFNLPLSALTAGLLALLVIRLGYSKSAAVTTGAAFAFGTFAWGQARIIFPEPLQTLLLLCASVLLLRTSARCAWLGGCALALAVLLKVTSILALPAFLFLPAKCNLPLWRRPKIVLGIIAPVLAAIALYGWYNYARFGSFFSTGYTTWGKDPEFSGNALGNPLIGLFGLLFSPGRGLIWYAPLAVIAAIAGRRFYLEQRRVAFAFALLALIWIGAHSFYLAWDAGWGWGPRYLLPVLPFLFCPMAAAWDSGKGRSGCVTLLAAGIVIQLPGALVDFMASGHQALSVFLERAHEHWPYRFTTWRDFTITGSEIVRHSDLLLRGQLDLAWLTFPFRWLRAITFALAAVLFSAGIALLLPPLLTSRRTHNIAWAVSSNTSSAHPHERVNPTPPCP